MGGKAIGSPILKVFFICLGNCTAPPLIMLPYTLFVALFHAGSTRRSRVASAILLLFDLFNFLLRNYHKSCVVLCTPFTCCCEFGWVFAKYLQGPSRCSPV